MLLEDWRAQPALPVYSPRGAVEGSRGFEPPVRKNTTVTYHVVIEEDLPYHLAMR
jgi:hypothetical protein